MRFSTLTRLKGQQKLSKVSKLELINRFNLSNLFHVSEDKQRIRRVRDMKREPVRIFPFQKTDHRVNNVFDVR